MIRQQLIHGKLPPRVRKLVKTNIWSISSRRGDLMFHSPPVCRYFPTAEAYTQLLTSTTLDPPFQIECCDLVPRPTPLPNGLSSWLETFGGSFLNVLPTAKDRADAVAELEELLRPDLFDPQTGTWTAMCTYSYFVDDTHRLPHQ